MIERAVMSRDSKCGVQTVIKPAGAVVRKVVVWGDHKGIQFFDDKGYKLLDAGDIGGKAYEGSLQEGERIVGVRLSEHKRI